MEQEKLSVWTKHQHVGLSSAFEIGSNRLYRHFRKQIRGDGRYKLVVLIRVRPRCQASCSLHVAIWKRHEQIGALGPSNSRNALAKG